MLDRREAFVALADTGSFAGAARRLGVARSTVMRRVEALEEELGVVLAQRAGARVVLTLTGERYAGAMRASLDELARAERRALGAVSGPLRIWLPLLGTSALLMRGVAAFQRTQRDVVTRIEMGQNIRRLELGTFDVALQVGTRVNRSLLFQPLYTERMVLVASRDYVEEFGAPATLDALDDHLGVHEHDPEGRLVPWRHPNGRRSAMPPATAHVNAIGAAYELALHGAGIARVPELLARERLASGELVELLPDVHTEETVGFVYMPDPTPTARAFLDFITNAMRSPGPYESA